MNINVNNLEQRLQKALLAMPPEQRADINRFQQKVGAIMADTSKPMEERTAELLKMNKEMQSKYGTDTNK